MQANSFINAYKLLILKETSVIGYLRYGLTRLAILLGGPCPPSFYAYDSVTSIK